MNLHLHRRHLNASQRAVVAARMANMPQGGDRGVNQHGEWQAANLPVGTITQPEAAKLLNVSERSVRDALGYGMDRTDTLNRGSRSANLPTDGITQSEAAKLLNVSERSVRDALGYGMGRLTRSLNFDAPAGIVAQAKAIVAMRVCHRSLRWLAKTARRWMACYKRKDKLDTMSNLTPTDAYKLLASPGVVTEFEFDVRTAQNWMRCFNNRSKYDTMSHLTPTDAYKRMATCTASESFNAPTGIVAMRVCHRSLRWLAKTADRLEGRKA